MSCRRSLASLALVFAMLVFTACGGGADPSLTGGESSLTGHSHVPVCPGPAGLAAARCHSWIRTDESGVPLATAAPRGYGPSDLQSAYNLPSSSGGVGQTI